MFAPLCPLLPPPPRPPREKLGRPPKEGREPYEDPPRLPPKDGREDELKLGRESLRGAELKLLLPDENLLAPAGRGDGLRKAGRAELSLVLGADDLGFEPKDPPALLKGATFLICFFIIIILRKIALITKLKINSKWLVSLI